MCDFFFFFQAEDGIRDYKVTGVQTCALRSPTEQAQHSPSQKGKHNGRPPRVPMHKFQVPLSTGEGVRLHHAEPASSWKSGLARPNLVILFKVAGTRRVGIRCPRRALPNLTQ